MAFPVDLALRQDIVDLLAAAVAVAGLCVCLLGLRLWPAVCSIGCLAAAFVAGAAFALDRAPDKLAIALALGAAGGVAAAIVGAYAYRLVTIGAYGLIGWCVGSQFAASGGLEQTDQLAAALGGAMVAAVVAVLFDVVAVMLLGAIAGAWAAVWSACLYFGSAFAQQADLWSLAQNASAYRLPLLAVGALAVVGLFAQAFAYVHAGPDPREVIEALDRADLPRKRRVAVLDDLRADGLITRTEYFRHLVRILSGG